MYTIAVVLSLIATCYCEVEFSERPRNFSIELVYHTQQETDGHVVISPFGIWTLMAGLLVGATNNSFRELALATFMGKIHNKHYIKSYQHLMSTVLSPKTNDVSLSSTNFLFLDDNFQVYPQYRHKIEDELNATIHVLDFQDTKAVEAANAEIEKTGANVRNVLQSNDFTHSVMLLTNVIAFRGVWCSPFNKTATNLEEFYDKDGKSIGHVNMMYQNRAVPFSNIPELESYVLEMSYGTDEKYSMLFLLPHPGVYVVNAYKNLAHMSLQDVFKKLKQDEETYDKQAVDIKIPRFHISSNVIMNKPLNHMGIYDIFEADRASFGKISKDNIFVSSIVHKADIEVTEEGTTASASTTANFINKIGTTKFYLNRPFVYFLMEKSTSTIIFAGIYSKPTVY